MSNSAAATDLSTDAHNTHEEKRHGKPPRAEDGGLRPTDGARV
jgi:hypothetical protein